MASKRLLRALLTLTTLAVVWLVASPALAASASAGAMSMMPAPVSMESATFTPLPKAAPPPTTWGAPLCDPRGATTFAPPPQMQDAEASLDSALTLDDCLTSALDEHHASSDRGRGPTPLDRSSSSDAAALVAVATLAAAARELQPVPVASTLCPRPGIRSTIDRPPRA